MQKTRKKYRSPAMPADPESIRLNRLLPVRFSRNDLLAVKSRAEAAGMKCSDWVRWRLKLQRPRPISHVLKKGIASGNDKQ